MDGLKSDNHHRQSLPPRRGQIKAKIFNSMFKSAAAFASSAAGHRRRHEDDGTPLSSPSPATPISSGYNSDS
ncbi:hypothetical protein QN277_003037 [Acacia crassicarpa]|uniref:Uncharacterized protein n=1 Tax=Acacia crassicarpa TaxID=499986 RepID=A0AAE1TIG5_9FABA|nr:hypothetical protein QN277_003037 [Acacia crassicarpa]